MALDFTQLEESSYLLDLLIQMEDVLDSMDVFAFKNWFDAEIIEGPLVGRYWLSMTLKRNYHNMPDPRAAKRLVRQGVLVRYDHVENESEDEGEDEGKTDTAESVDKVDQKDDDADGFWLIKISIPRRLITEINSEEIAFYDDDVDIEDVQDANDEGMDDESAFDVDDQNAEVAPTPDEAQPEAEPPQEPQGNAKGREG